jgi:hypothetical protein
MKQHTQAGRVHETQVIQIDDDPSGRALLGVADRIIELTAAARSSSPETAMTVTFDSSLVLMIDG